MARNKKEAYEQAKTKKWLRKTLGAYVVKNVVATEDGTPDLIGCFRDHFFGIEMKRKGEKTSENFGASPLQNEKLGDIIRAGGIAFCAETLEVVKYHFGNELIKRGIDPRPMK